MLFYIQSSRGGKRTPRKYHVRVRLDLYAPCQHAAVARGGTINAVQTVVLQGQVGQSVSCASTLGGGRRGTHEQRKQEACAKVAPCTTAVSSSYTNRDGTVCSVQALSL